MKPKFIVTFLHTFSCALHQPHLSLFDRFAVFCECFVTVRVITLVLALQFSVENHSCQPLFKFVSYVKLYNLLFDYRSCGVWIPAPKPASIRYNYRYNTKHLLCCSQAGFYWRWQCYSAFYDISLFPDP